MKVLSSFEISASGLTAERLRMDVTANNIANVETTRTPEGGPYRRQMVVFEPREEQAPFQLPSALRGAFSDSDDAAAPADDDMAGFANQGVDAVAKGVHVVAVVSDPSAPHLVYEPGHPDADANGYVAMPNVSMINEMVDMMSATRAYQANIAAIDSAKSMAQQAMSIVGQSTAF